MKTEFDDYLEKETHIRNGSFEINGWMFAFPNGHGASVVCHRLNNKIISYGDEEHPYELAVLDHNGICYTSGIADEVVGYLDEDGVNEYLGKIFSLRSRA